MAPANDDMVEFGEGPSGARPGARRRSEFRLPVPASTLMNFAAMLLLFGGISLLHGMGEDCSRGAASTDAPEIQATIAPAQPAPVEAVPEKVEKPAVASLAALPRQEDEGIAAEVEPRGEVSEPAPTPERPALDRRAVEKDRRIVKEYEARKARAKKAAAPERYAADRSFPLELLDNEVARQRYLAANLVVSGQTAGVESEFVKSPER